MSIKLLNSFGMVLDIAGAVVMFCNTPHPSQKPQLNDVISESGSWLLFGSHLEKKEIHWVRIGMGLLVIGFVLQFISSVL